MNTFAHVPPGFRFHPTDEELVDYYLRKKVASKRIDLDVIKDVDLYKIEPWDLQELCKIGTDDQNEWYFFSHKDKKYPTGTRTNRATKAGFWKATGRDKAIYMRHSLVGMRKTLVFYKGRAPNGQKSDWIMHEYRLETQENGVPQEEGWVVCRVFKKRMPTVRRMGEYESPCWYNDNQLSSMPDSPSPLSHPALVMNNYNLYHNQNHNNNHHHHRQQQHHYMACKQELESQFNANMSADPFLFQLPQLESPKLPLSSTTTQDDHHHQNNLNALYIVENNNDNNEIAVDQVTDWRVLDKFVASQLSHGHDQDHNNNISSKGTSNNGAVFDEAEQFTPQIVQDYGSSSSSLTCHIDLWK